MTLRYEGVRFSDGSCAVRRIASDPCDRATLTFETVRELEEDIGSAEVTWLVDRGAAGACTWCARGGACDDGDCQKCCACGRSLAPIPAPTRSRPPVPGEVDAYFAHAHAHALATKGIEIVELQPGEQPRAFVPPPPRPEQLPAIRAVDEFAAPMRPAYLGDGHPSVRASRYEPTEEIDEP